MAIERLLSTQNQPLKRPVLVYLECLLVTQRRRSRISRNKHSQSEKMTDRIDHGELSK